MRSGLIRRSLAAASATVMAGAALVVGGAGVASAAPVSASTVVAGNLFESQFTINRTVSEGSPTYGDVVTVTTNVRRDSGGYLLYEVRDFTPACMEYVPGSAVANKGGDIEVNTERVRWSRGLGREANPFTMTAQYTVLCDAGPRSTGGTWMKRAPAGSSELGNRNMGPSINVLRKGTSVYLHQPTNPQVNQTVTLSVLTTNVPDNAQVSFTADGVEIGKGTVSGNQASVPWTPTSAGQPVIRAIFAQTGTHAFSQSAERTVSVSPTNVNSTVNVTLDSAPKVGQTTQVTATVDPAGAGGTVTFRANTTQIGQATVQADGTAVINWIPSAAELTTIEASFSGRQGVNPSVGAAPSLNVLPADPGAVATTTTLDDVAVTAIGNTVPLTARVVPSTPGAVIGGSVEFYDGQVLIGTSAVNNQGVAIFQWNPGAEGARTIRAVFAPTSAHLASQGTAQVIITPAPIDEDPEPEPEPSDPGASGSLGSLTGSLGS